MVIVKYGNSKKLEDARRWKCKCKRCGCKMIADREDLVDYRKYEDLECFDVVCPFCNCKFEVNFRSFSQKVSNIWYYIDRFVDNHFILSFCIGVFLALLLLFGIVFGIYKIDETSKSKNDSIYNYRIEYNADGKDKILYWTDSYVVDGNRIKFLCDGDEISVDYDHCLIKNCK